MKEIIQSIDEIGVKYGWLEYKGIEITTNLQTIQILISNEQYCCENAGYFSCEDMYDFIGAEINDIHTTDECLHTELLNNNFRDISINSCMFINIETNKGTFQITVYNEHRGNYAHDVRIMSKQLKIEQEL